MCYQQTPMRVAWSLLRVAQEEPHWFRRASTGTVQLIRPRSITVPTQMHAGGRVSCCLLGSYHHTSHLCCLPVRLVVSFGRHVTSVRSQLSKTARKILLECQTAWYNLNKEDMADLQRELPCQLWGLPDSNSKFVPTIRSSALGGPMHLCLSKPCFPRLVMCLQVLHAATVQGWL